MWLVNSLQGSIYIIVNSFYHHPFIFLTLAEATAILAIIAAHSFIPAPKDI